MILEEKYMKGDKPDIKLVRGCWLAGGAIRRWYSGEPQHGDFDIFFADRASIVNFLHANKHIMGKELVLESEELLVYRLENGRTIQLILDFGTKTPQETIDKFDFTICQFALDHTGEIISTPASQRDVENKKLRIVEGGLRKGYEVNLMRRAMKYIGQGYKIEIETIQQIAMIIHEAKYSDIEDPFPFLSPDQEA